MLPTSIAGCVRTKCSGVRTSSERGKLSQTLSLCVAAVACHSLCGIGWVCTPLVQCHTSPWTMFSITDERGHRFQASLTISYQHWSQVVTCVKASTLEQCRGQLDTWRKRSAWAERRHKGYQMLQEHIRHSLCCAACVLTQLESSSQGGIHSFVQVRISR